MPPSGTRTRATGPSTRAGFSAAASRIPTHAATAHSRQFLMRVLYNQRPQHATHGTDLAKSTSGLTMRIRTILVPTDFGPSSTAAWRYAQEIAIRFDSNVHLVHVLAPPPFIEDPHGTDQLMFQVADLLKETAREVERVLSRVVARPALDG